MMTHNAYLHRRFPSRHIFERHYIYPSRNDLTSKQNTKTWHMYCKRQLYMMVTQQRYTTTENKEHSTSLSIFDDWVVSIVCQP